MALNSTALQVGATAIAADIAYVTLHSAQPDGSGSNQTTADPEAVTCTATGGVITVPQTSFSGGASNGACTYAGLWDGDPDASGAWLGSFALDDEKDLVFNAAGEYVLDASTVTFS